MNTGVGPKDFPGGSTIPYRLSYSKVWLSNQVPVVGLLGLWQESMLRTAQYNFLDLDP